MMTSLGIGTLRPTALAVARRTLLLLFATLAHACTSSPAPPERYVLVHGAWMGAWALQDVARELRSRGADVAVVELPAHGADQTAIAGATLDAYVSTVAQALDASGAPVVLVAHSMGGMVVSAFAEQHPDKVSKLIYLAAYVPRDGQSLFDLASADSGSHIGPVLQIDEAAGTAGLPSDQLADIFCADCSADAAAALAAHYRVEPLAPLATPVHVSDGNWGRVARYYLYTTQDHAVSIAAQHAMVDGRAFTATRTLDTSHSPFLSQPAAVVDALASF